MRQIQKQYSARPQFLEPKRKCLLPLGQMLQAVRAEHIVETAVGEPVELIGVLVRQFLDDDRTGERATAGTDIEAVAITVFRGQIEYKRRCLPVGQVLGV